MRFICILAIAIACVAPRSAAVNQSSPILELSRSSGVMLQSRAGNSKGSGAFIGEQHVLTCFHVIAAISVQGQNVNWAFHPDLQVVLPSGETIEAQVVSVPTQADPSPLQHDFAIVKLKTKPTKPLKVLALASDGEFPSVGDEVVFSGYPLATPGMVTHRGMVSGFEASQSLIFVQASINKGNSGGALLNGAGRIIGIVSMREGGISQGLNELKVNIDKGASQGSVQIMGIDPLQATRSIIQTLDHFISTGIGYARSAKFVRDYLNKNPALLK